MEPLTAPAQHQAAARTAGEPEHRTERRLLIAEAATEIIAHEGLRALTHRAIDTRLDLSSGSTSYYYRTRDELLEAIVNYLRERSAADFEAADLQVPDSVDGGRDIEDVASHIARYLDIQLSARPHHIKARIALTLELSEREEFAGIISDVLVSQAQMSELFGVLGSTEPDTLARGFTALVEGLAFRSLLESGHQEPAARTRRVAVFREAIASFLLGAAD
ncbi:TetR/AcrR family transcriptional regulator [Crystallibacter crystallopoietes]|uniref:TetR/AcrR family transcriptional regulator n=1 Tax=Crystallibacter crystallopoietes TaxID=37928 RepID=UPI00192A7FB3|nr:TetR family transcriptional regulator [Arthrobacter crystallopoietes]